MSYREEGGGRAQDQGTPADEELGMGSSFDATESASHGRLKAPSFEFRPEQLEAYRGAGYELIALHAPNALDARGRSLGKVPGKGWRDCAPLSVDEAAEIMREGRNVGVRLRANDLVVDVDPRNFAHGDDDPLKRLEEAIGADLSAYSFPRVRTGSGGLHIYMRLTEPVGVVDRLDGFDGIEFKSLGRQVVAAGSAHPETGRPYVWEKDPLGPTLNETPLAPEKLIALITRLVSQSNAEVGEYDPEQLETMLAGLDPCDFADHDKWFQLMAACHHATAGSGREEFIAWSTADPSYSDQASIIGRRWDSLHADGAGRRVTAASLRKALIDAGREDLIPRTSAEEDFAEVPVEAEPSEPKPQVRGLADEWVWIADIERFVRRSDTKKFNKDQFKSMFQHKWPDGDICSPVWKGKLPVRRVESLAYVPSEPEFISSGQCEGSYNLWRRSGVEPKRGDVSVFLEHMTYLFPNETERGYVLDYLSLLVAEPFVKVNFALLVRGKQGTGKSFLGKLVRHMIGERNVSMPLSSEVTKEFTGWQEGVQLAILEEMMALGRTDVANRLKPVTTDDFLRIRLMYTNPYSTPNFLNLLCFTNHDDALPIEHADRRWLVVFSDVEPRESAYYERLFGLLEGDGPAAVKHFLQQRQIGLNPKGVAPITSGKSQMRRLSLSDAEQYLAELLDEGAKPFDFDLVKLDDVVGAVPVDIRRQSRNLRNKVARWLRDEVRAVKHTRYSKQDGSGRLTSYLWSIRNHDEWTKAGAAARIDAYMEHAKLK